MKRQLKRQDGPESTEFLPHIITITSSFRAVPGAVDICKSKPHGRLERARTGKGWVCGPEQGVEMNFQWSKWPGRHNFPGSPSSQAPGFFHFNISNITNSSEAWAEVQGWHQGFYILAQSRGIQRQPFHMQIQSDKLSEKLERQLQRTLNSSQWGIFLW